MKLHVLGPSPHARKVRLLVEYLELPVQVLFREHSALKEDDYLSLNPMGAVPLLEDGDHAIWESNAILIYLSKHANNTDLLPEDAISQAKIHQWMFWEQANFVKAVGGLLFNNYLAPKFFGLKTDDEAVTRALGFFHKFMPILEAQLSQHDFAIGDNLTVADFCLNGFFTHIDDARMPIADYPAVENWNARLNTIPAWKKVIC